MILLSAAVRIAGLGPRAVPTTNWRRRRFPGDSARFAVCSQGTSRWFPAAIIAVRGLVIGDQQVKAERAVSGRHDFDSRAEPGTNLTQDL
jgi:hypothetical protein